MLTRILLLGVLACLSTPAFAGSVEIPVPEPASLAVLAVGIAGAAIVRKVRRRR